MITLINFVFGALELTLLAYVLLPWFNVSPFHPVRQTLESIVGPFLRPVQRIMPRIGMIDISPIVLFLLLQVIHNTLLSVLR